MLVKLARTFFGPNGFRYRKGVRDLPDSFLKCLPNGAEIIDAPKAKLEKKEEAGDKPEKDPELPLELPVKKSKL